MVYIFNNLNEFLSEVLNFQIFQTIYNMDTKLIVHSLYLLLTKIDLKKSDFNLVFLYNLDMFNFLVSIR